MTKIMETSKIGNTGYTLNDLIQLLNNKETLYEGSATSGTINLSKKITNYSRLALLLNSNNNKFWLNINEVQVGQRYSFVFDGESAVNTFIGIVKMSVVIYEQSIQILVNLLASGAVGSKLEVADADWYKIRINKVIGYKV